MGFSLSQSAKQRVLDKTGGHCFYCGAGLYIGKNEQEGKKRMNTDHFFPQILGGGHDFHNLVPSCNRCNCQKKDRRIDEFREWIRWNNIGGRLNQDQIDWLEENGFEFPEPPPHVFWAETQGWKIILAEDAVKQGVGE